ncbi:ABC transporter permease [Staphylococcus hyicus]|uniref:ABC transporter permease n=1 Tax=Staphylococcus hyicus TaxID=1284 RepID=UPI00208E5904|nr:ABC transporter permease [Staphylococcus hyicus]MCO4328510.1 ABC transporter permease [Staphylococcus hyicus]MCO4331681.1 ABC transporter permease [Staphylococcus hyicus]MCO4334695.1 ABC transporter permease [Staphylococcus hyicus]MCO4335548.1 ABC transporter permease [Staphylococcus hyicus]
MLRFNAMLTRVVKEILRDKRTLALMMIAPILILSLMYFVFNSNNDQHLKIGIDHTVPSSIVDSLPTKDINYKHYQQGTAHTHIKDDHLDVYIQFKHKKIAVTYANEDPTKTAQAKMILQQSLIRGKMKILSDNMQVMKKALQTQAAFIQNVLPAEAKVQLLQQVPPYKINQNVQYELENSYLYGSGNSTFFDKVFPVLIGFFVFFFVFLISGIALLKERTTGTLNRLMATPIKRSEIVLGYLVGFGIFAVIQTLVIVSFAVFLLDLHIEGNILWVFVTNILLALVALSMGIFVSTFANSEFQMMQFIPIVVIPQVFFSGIIPIDQLANWVKSLSMIFPLTYGGNALTAVMIKGEGLDSIWMYWLILIGFTTIFTALNIMGLKRYRKV